MKFENCLKKMKYSHGLFITIFSIFTLVAVVAMAMSIEELPDRQLKAFVLEQLPIQKMADGLKRVKVIRGRDVVGNYRNIPPWFRTSEDLRSLNDIAWTHFLKKTELESSSTASLLVIETVRGDLLIYKFNEGDDHQNQTPALEYRGTIFTKLKDAQVDKATQQMLSRSQSLEDSTQYDNVHLKGKNGIDLGVFKRKIDRAGRIISIAGPAYTSNIFTQVHSDKTRNTREFYFPFPVIFDTSSGSEDLKKIFLAMGFYLANPFPTNRPNYWAFEGFDLEWLLSGWALDDRGREMHNRLPPIQYWRMTISHNNQIDEFIASRKGLFDWSRYEAYLPDQNRFSSFDPIELDAESIDILPEYLKRQLLEIPISPNFFSNGGLVGVTANVDTPKVIFFEGPFKNRDADSVVLADTNSLYHLFSFNLEHSDGWAPAIFSGIQQSQDGRSLGLSIYHFDGPEAVQVREYTFEMPKIFRGKSRLNSKILASLDPLQARASDLLPSTQSFSQGELPVVNEADFTADRWRDWFRNHPTSLLDRGSSSLGPDCRKVLIGGSSSEK